MTPSRTAERRDPVGARVVRRPKQGLSSGRGGQPRRVSPDSAQLVLDLDLPVAVLSSHGCAAPSGLDPQRTVEGTRPGDRFHRSDIALAVIAFHTAFGLPRQALPSIHVDEEIAKLRVSLLVEEVEEFATATQSRDLVGIADALADIVYVAYGAAATYGIDLDAVLAEVHRANMSKLDGDGRPVLRADGKVVKSERYRPPNVAGVLHQQLPLPLL